MHCKKKKEENIDCNVAIVTITVDLSYFDLTFMDFV